jgi:hypothetical protein
MDAIFSSLLSVDVMVTAAVVAGIVEGVKRAAIQAGLDGQTAWFKTAMAVTPLLLGAVLGQLIITTEASAPPWAVGIVAGMMSSKVYDMLAPAVKQAAGSATK